MQERGNFGVLRDLGKRLVRDQSTLALVADRRLTETEGAEATKAVSNRPFPIQIVTREEQGFVFKRAVIISVFWDCPRRDSDRARPWNAEEYARLSSPSSAEPQAEIHALSSPSLCKG